MEMINTIMLLSEQMVNDDDQVICNSTEGTLEKVNTGGKIFTFNNTEDALDYLKFQCCSDKLISPEWIVFDHSFPQQDCVEFLTAFENLSFSNKEQVLIIRLGAIGEEDRKVLKGAGVNQFVSAPANLNEIKSLYFKYQEEQQETKLRKAS
ncbi:MAG: hypothetical protein ACJ75J_08660 [Cytophagaceae bacterium]